MLFRAHIVTWQESGVHAGTGARRMAASAYDFDFVRDSFTVSTAVLFLFRGNAGAGGIGAFLSGDGHVVSFASLCLQSAIQSLRAYDAGIRAKDGSQFEETGSKLTTWDKLEHRLNRP